MIDVHTGQVLIASGVTTLLVLIGRASATLRNVRRDGAEGNLYQNMINSLESSERRRLDEAARFERREAEYERRHTESQEKITLLREEVARLNQTISMVHDQMTKMQEACTRMEEQNRMLLADLAVARGLSSNN